jgi:hypothetical protein
MDILIDGITVQIKKDANIRFPSLPGEPVISLTTEGDIEIRFMRGSMGIHPIAGNAIEIGLIE